MSALGCPAHLLLLDHACADHLVDGGLDERAGDRFARSIPLAIIWDPRAVGSNVATELGDQLEQLLLLMARMLGGVEVELEVFDRLQRTEDVAVPQQPLQS